MSERTVYVRFRESRSGQSELRYAASLCRRLDADLMVIAPEPCSSMRVLGLADVWSPDPLRRELIRFASGTTPHLPTGSLLVGDFGDWPKNELLRHHRLYPRDQEEFCPPKTPPKLLVPFGKGGSGERAGALAVSLSRAMSDPAPSGAGHGSEIVFYHTTWRNPALPPALPRLHMHPGSAATQARLDELARDINHRSRIETASDVVSGIVGSALAENADLIVMARGVGTCLGSYMDRVLARTTVPVIVALEVSP